MDSFSLGERGREGQYSVAMQPTPLSDRTRDGGRTTRKRAAVLAQVGRYEFDPRGFEAIEGERVVYWWSRDFKNLYQKSTKLGDVTPAKYGLGTRNDLRFIRFVWEVKSSSVYLSRDKTPLRQDCHGWFPYVKGASGRIWLEPVTSVVAWALDGFFLRVWIDYYRITKPGGFITNDRDYFRSGVSVKKIGTPFTARAHRFRSISVTRLQR